MPQMAPLSWLTLFSFFTIIFILFNIINYYITLPLNLKSSNEFKISASLPLPWQW